MHEISLVRTIAATLEEEFSEKELARLEQIRLRVGLLSNVEPRLMQNAFAAVQEGEGKFLGVELSITTVPIRIYCESCDRETEIEDYRFACGHCQQPNNNLIAGTELLIERVTFAD